MVNQQYKCGMFLELLVLLKQNQKVPIIVSGEPSVCVTNETILSIQVSGIWWVLMSKELTYALAPHHPLFYLKVHLASLAC